MPGAALGAGGAADTIGAWENSKLTVDFHEPGFVSSLQQENSLTLQHGFWFQLSDQDKQQAGEPWGPSNPQALNRYAYVLDNPLRYVDPTGHAYAVESDTGLPQYVIDEYNLGDPTGSKAALASLNAGDVLTVVNDYGVKIKVQWRVKENADLLKEANKLGGTDSEDVQNLIRSYLNGNKNPGVGTKFLDNGYRYLRAKNGARVFIRDSGGVVQILGYATKINESRVFQLLRELYPDGGF